MFKERKVVAVALMLVDALRKMNTVPLEDIEKAVPDPAAVPDEIKSVNVAAMKLMYTKNCNPNLLLKAQAGSIKHGLNAWIESRETVLGDDKSVMSKYRVAKEIPVPASTRFAWAFYKGGLLKKSFTLPIALIRQNLLNEMKVKTK